MVKNIVGKPVIGSNFFGRTREVGQISELLETDNLLLLAPRRVGKTSLMYWLQDHPPSKGWTTIYESVADVKTELEFVCRLYKAARAHKLAAKALSKLRKGSFDRWFQRLEEVSVPGFAIKLADADAPDWTQLADELTRTLGRLDGDWLFLIDELPIFVLQLIRADESGQRASTFLNWFRQCRMAGECRSLHWLLAGSIGLNTVAQRHGLSGTINDLRIHDNFGPFSTSTAHDFLDALGESYGISLSELVKARVCAHISWLIPYYLNLYFAELRSLRDDIGSRALTVDDVEAVRDRLLSPSKRTYFDYWQQRLRDELGAIDGKRAIKLLDRIAANPDGERESTLSAVLHGDIPDPDERQEHLMYLLGVLRNDGYLIHERQRYQFRSTLLRDFWRLRRVP